MLTVCVLHLCPVCPVSHIGQNKDFLKTCFVSVKKLPQCYQILMTQKMLDRSVPCCFSSFPRIYSNTNIFLTSVECTVILLLCWQCRWDNLHISSCKHFLFLFWPFSLFVASFASWFTRTLSSLHENGIANVGVKAVLSDTTISVKLFSVWIYFYQ